ncbi:MAG TPA: NAD(P)-binding domain-containing protein [Acidobacteriota bacterium]|nr:NAD(P)-binding domain-containing protein [Acidobacteriota bacterium]
MAEKSVGFVGGGRVARIILGGLDKAGRMPRNIVASDTNPDVLKRLQAKFLNVRTALNDNRKAAAQDLVFLGLHPPALSGALAEIRDCLKPGATVISLAPKLSISRLADEFGGFDRIARLIPNAASIIGEGYNPIAYSKALSPQEKEEIQSLLSALGKCPEVAEAKLEAYAVITAMGPTYLWFQLHELRSLGESFGMSAEEAESGIAEMVVGTVRTLFGSGMSADEAMDLIPVKPMGEDEASITAMYRARLEPLYNKLKS